MNKIMILILLFSLTIFAGCFNVDIEQEIKRNGNFDMKITFQSDIPMAISSMEEELEVNSELEEFVTIESTSNSITYVFTDIDPTQNDLFTDIDDSTSESSLFESDTYSFTREFRFPFYHYRYEIKMPVDEDHIEAGFEDDIQFDEEDLFGDEFAEMFENLFNIGYTVKVFGKITDSNGEIINDNEVKFSLLSNTEEVLYVEFRDLFFMSWFSR